MRRRDVELWTLRVVDALRAGQPVEDSRVELKRTWIEPARAARRLAGHANAARGEEILWIIGVDEKSREVPGAEATAFADWWAQVSREFSELAPPVLDVNVAVAEGVVVTALAFETDRAPFVVRNPTGQGGIDREVPWRDATGVRSATRTDLLRLLAPIQDLPLIDLLDAYAVFYRPEAAKFPAVANWGATVDVYVTPGPGREVAFPRHKAALHLEVPGQGRIEFSSPQFMSSDKTSTTSSDTAILHHPTRLRVDGTNRAERPYSAEVVMPAEVRVDLALVPAGADRPVAVSVPLLRSDDKQKAHIVARWTWQPQGAPRTN